jgi:hypothetical protein
MAKARPPAKPLSKFIAAQVAYQSQGGQQAKELAGRHAEAVRQVRLLDGTKLGRVFNHFPAITDKAIIDAWSKTYIDILRSVKLIQAQSAEDKDMSVTVVAPGDVSRIVTLVDQFITNAFESLIQNTARGVIRNDVIQFLRWEAKDADQNHKVQAHIQMSAFAIVSAFAEVCYECVYDNAAIELLNTKNPNAGYVLKSEKNNPKAKVIPSDNVQAVSLALARVKYSARVEEALPIAYCKMIRRNANLTSREIAKDFVEYIATAKPTIDDAERLARQLSADLNIEIKSAADRKEKLKFWLEVIAGCNDSKMGNEVSAACWQAFKLCFCAADDALLDQAAKEQYERFVKANPQPSVPYPEVNKSEENFKQWLNARDNAFLVNHFHQYLDVDKMYQNLRLHGGDENMGPRAEKMRDETVFILAQILAARMYSDTPAGNLDFARNSILDTQEVLTEERVFLYTLLNSSITKLMKEMNILPVRSDRLIGAKLEQAYFEKTGAGQQPLAARASDSESMTPSITSHSGASKASLDKNQETPSPTSTASAPAALETTATPKYPSGGAGPGSPSPRSSKS